MHPRISETRSVFRNVPAGLRRPPRGTFVVAAATAATALVTVATVASASASTPATHHAAQAAARTAAASSAAPAPARHVTGQPAQARPARGAHLTVKVAPKAGRPTQHRAAPKAPAMPARPYRMYDSVTPSAIPAHQAGAVYSTGAYSASPAQVSHLGHALWIDTTGHNYSASVLDVEPGDATPAQAASWAFHRLQANHHALARIYTMRSQWPAAQAAVRGLPGWMQSQIRWWIADPTGVPHIVPGASATQWYWGSSYDLSLVKPGF